jgi:formylglycine-generating enzyme required for sulfatase activity
MKRWAIIGGAAVLAIVAIVVILKLTGSEKAAPPRVVEGPKGPDPAHLARVEKLAKEAEELEAKGEFKDALSTLRELAKLEPADPRPAAMRPRLEEKLKRMELWQSAQKAAEGERKDATRRDTSAAWQKVLDLCAEAEKLAPGEKQQRLSRELVAPAKQMHAWVSAREEERKGNVPAALDLATQAIGFSEPPADLTAYKAALEKKKRKLDYDRAASAARSEAVPAKAYELWQKARPLAEDPKDAAEADAKLEALKPWVDPAERTRRYDAALKAGEEALAKGDLDAAEKSFTEAKALQVTELKPGQGLTRVAAARKLKAIDTAVAEAKAAEQKKEWADAIEAYDRALKLKPGDSALTARRKELEEGYRPPKIEILISDASGTKIEFVLIKRGTYTMGDAAGNSDEKPHPAVVEKDFWMQPTELTQAHWTAVMNTKPWMSSSIPHLPVEGVSWEDAQKFFEKFNLMVKERLQGRRAGLPSEIEWEYACRAGTPTRWSFGSDETKFDAYGWSSAAQVKGPQTVGKKQPNPWGLFDMHGNVAEWCADGYAGYGEKIAEEPQYRVYRGGSWNDRPGSCRSSKRERDVSTKSNLFLGFRAVLR